MVSTNLSVCCLNSSIHLFSSHQSRCGPEPRCSHLLQTPSRGSGFSLFRWFLPELPAQFLRDKTSPPLFNPRGAELWQVLGEFLSFFHTEEGPRGWAATSVHPLQPAAPHTPQSHHTPADADSTFLLSWGRLTSCTHPSLACREARARPGFPKSKRRKAWNHTCGTTLISTQVLIETETVGWIHCKS